MAGLSRRRSRVRVSSSPPFFQGLSFLCEVTGFFLVMPFYVYILQSMKDGSYYIGSTNNLEDRIERHNQGRSQYTKLRRPWKLVYSEELPDRSSAVRRGTRDLPALTGGTFGSGSQYTPSSFCVLSRFHALLQKIYQDTFQNRPISRASLAWCIGSALGYAFRHDLLGY